MSLFSSAKIEIEFTAGTFTDVSAYQYSPAFSVIQAGRPTEFDNVGPTEVQAYLRNDDGRFTPDNSSSPYYPNSIEGKRLRCSVTKGGTTTTRFTGYITSWEMQFPQNDVVGCVVILTAYDSLSVLANKTMPSPWGSTALGLAASNSTWVDEFACGTSAFAVNTNSANAAQSFAVAGYSVLTPPSFTADSSTGTSFDGYVNVPTGMTGAIAFYARAGAVICEFNLSCSVPTAGTGNPCVEFYAERILVGYLWMQTNGVLYYNDTPTNTNTSLGFNFSSYPTNTFCKITLVQNVGTATLTDIKINDAFVFTVPSGHLDFATFDTVALVGGVQNSYSFGGLTFAGSTAVTVPYVNASPTATGWTVATRWTAYQSAVSGLLFNPGWQVIGNDSGRACVTGSWAGKTALAVAQEIAATNNSIVWARWDGQVCIIHPDVAYPQTPLLTLSAEGDLMGAPDHKRSADTRPTRVTVNSPAVGLTVIDTYTESQAVGISRSISVNTLVTSQADAYSVAWAYMAAQNAMRFTSIVIDLDTGATDWTSALFNQSAAQGALFPSQRLAISLPSGIFGVSSRAFYISGWQEDYAIDHATVTIDGSPATTATVTGGTVVGTTGLGTVVYSSDRPLTTVGTAYPLDMDWSGERVTVGSAPASTTSPQTLTLTARGVTGGTAATSHSSGTSMDVWHSIAS